jgi:head-tail adaptor
VLRLRVQAAAHDGEQVQALALHVTLWGDAHGAASGKTLENSENEGHKAHNRQQCHNTG